MENQALCPRFGLCGGCKYGDISYGEELKIKEQEVRDLLAPVFSSEKYESIYKGIEKSPRELEYRNKMEFSFGDETKGGELTLGMHKRRSRYDIVSADECILVDSDARLIVKTTLDFFRKKGTPYFHKRSGEGYLRHLLLRKTGFTGQIMADIITTPDTDKGLIDEWGEVISSLTFKGELKSLLHTVNDRISDVVEDQGTRILYGEDFITESLLGLEFKITPFSFFQTNSWGAERLYSIVRELTPKSGTIYDLYSGTGTITQIVSGACKHAVGVEIVPEAVESAKNYARVNGIENVEFICGDVLKTLDDIEKKPDMIILDPPREGVVPKALDKILSYGVDTILYVSCKAKSLARDGAVFLERGYEPTYVSLVDMFPRTGNIETICVFKNKDFCIGD